MPVAQIDKVKGDHCGICLSLSLPEAALTSHFTIHWEPLKITKDKSQGSGK